MKQQNIDSERPVLFNLKYLIYMGAVYAIGFSASAALMPFGNYIVCCVITIMHLAIGIPLFIKLFKQYYNDNKETLDKVDDNTSRKELDTILKEIDEKQKTFNDKRCIQELLMLLWEVQIVVWTITIMNCFLKDAAIPSVSIIITTILGCIFSAYIGVISGNRIFKALSQIILIATFIQLEIGVTNLFWMAAFAYAVVFIVPSLWVLFKQSHKSK